jgi:hypothetical protein
VGAVEAELRFEAAPGTELLGLSGELRCDFVDGRRAVRRLDGRLRQLGSDGVRYEVEIAGGTLEIPRGAGLHSCSYGLVSRVLGREGWVSEGRTVIAGDVRVDRMTRFEVEALLSDGSLNHRIANDLAGLTLTP